MPDAAAAYITRVTRVSILPPNAPLFSEQCTHLTIRDDAAGEYLEICQQSEQQSGNPQTFLIEPAEWPVLKVAIDRMIDEITTHKV